MDRLTAKLVNRLTATLVNSLTAKLINHLTAKLVDRLIAKLMVVNLVKLHLTKSKPQLNKEKIDPLPIFAQTLAPFRCKTRGLPCNSSVKLLYHFKKYIASRLVTTSASQSTGRCSFCGFAKPVFNTLWIQVCPSDLLLFINTGK